MKKSIFLFFAAILCSMSINAAAVPSKLYLDASGWGYSDARYAAYFMPQNSFVDMTKATGEVSVFEVAVPASQTKVIFVRMNGATTVNNWDNKWNQTGDLNIPTNGKNKFKPSGWDGATTTWSTYTYTPPTFYIAGDFVTPNWSPNAVANKMDYADGVFSKSYNNVAASAHQFKITDGDWDGAIGYNQNTCSGTNCTVEGNGENIQFTPLAEGTVTITYTLADGKVHITCPEPPAAEFNITYPATQTNYTLVAGPAKAQAGTEVSFTATPAEGYVLNVTYNGNVIAGENNVYTFMMPASDVTIAITAVAATTLYYVDHNNWGNVNAYMWSDHGNNGWPGAVMALVGTVGDNAYSYYSISFAQGAYTSIIFNGGGSQTADLTINTAKPYFYDGNWYTWEELLAKLAAPVVKTYTVVGSSAPLFGEAWATAKTENDMTLVEGTKYELVKSDIALTAGDILYKVAVDHAWTESYPTDNLSLNIPKDGKYTVTFTFDSNTKEVGATAKLEEAVVVLPTIKVKGAWDGWTANTTLTGDNTSASATVNIATAGVYEFGLDVDGDFQASGAIIDKTNNSTVVTKNDGNMKLKANVLGDYTFTWTYETKTLVVTYPAGEEVEITKKYYIAGTQNLTGFDWQVDGLEIKKDGDVYKHTFSEMNAGTYEFKITDGTWTNQWGFSNLAKNYVGVSQGVDGEGNPNGNIKIVTEEAKNITVIFDLANNKITLENWAEAAPATISYVLMGVNGDWTNGIPMTVNPDNADEYVLKAQSISSTDAIKVLETAGSTQTWHSTVDAYSNATYTLVDDGFGGKNIVLTAGTYNFYFKKINNEIYIEEVYVRDVTNTYGTICLPYASNSYDGAIFYRVAGKETGKVYLESVSELEAGVPYIFEKTASKIVVARNGAPVASADNHNGLHGTFDNETVVAAGDYILLNNELRPSDGTAKVNANRAYLVMSEVLGGAPQPMPGRRYIGMSVQGENEATGVEDLFTTDAPVKVIENGQLIIIRDGVKYNVQGQKL